MKAAVVSESGAPVLHYAVSTVCMCVRRMNSVFAGVCICVELCRNIQAEIVCLCVSPARYRDSLPFSVVDGYWNPHKSQIITRNKYFIH